MPNETLRKIADDQGLLDALKALFERQFEVQPLDENNIGDVELGQMLRARLVGLRKIESAFQEIAKYKTVPEQPLGKNPGR